MLGYCVSEGGRSSAKLPPGTSVQLRLRGVDPVIGGAGTVEALVMNRSHRLLNSIHVPSLDVERMASAGSALDADAWLHKPRRK